MGGEPLRAHEVALAGEYFPRTTLANIYGQTESSVSSIWAIKPENRETFSRVIIGEPLDNTAILLMDEELNIVGPLEMGEIIVACPHLALGYRRNEEAGRKVFSIHPTYGKIYRTGDMGRLLIDGNIEFIGRKDSQVKIRGFRIELGEIESRLLKHEVIKEAIVNVVEIAGDKYLCAYIVCNNQMPGVENEELSTRLKVYLAEFLPDYMIPTHFICMERLPLTPGGKINRKALPMPEIGEINRNTHVAPRTFVEIKLHDIWHDVLKTPGEIGVTDDFFRLGGHSLRAAALASRIQKAFNVKVPLMEIFKRPTIGGLAQYINIAKKEKYAAIEPVEKREYYALSPAQKRLYILQQMEIESVHYNMPQVIPFVDKIDVERMEWVFKELIQRHEILRTSFVMVAEEPVQRIQAEVAFEIKVFAELFSKSDPPGPLPGRGSLLKFIRPFDLSQGPLLRAGIINYADGNSILLVDMHHIITDGTSNRILKEEFKTLYFGKGELPQLRLQYKDYSQWQNSKMHQELIKQQETYWLKSFEGELPVLHLPIDFIRPPVQTFEGCTVDFFIEAAEIIDLKKLTVEVKASLFMVILAAFNVLLFKLTGQEDIVIGTPAAARRHTDLEGIIGMFVNILALRNYPIAEKPFLVFFKELKSRTLAVFENQEYPFEDLVDKLAVPRDTGRNPIFDIVFNLLNQKDYNSENPGNTDIIRNINGHKKGVAKFDMTLTAVEFREGVFFTFEYCTRLFKPGTIDRMIGYFKHILEQLALAPNLPIGEIEIMSEYERRQILNEFNGSETVYLIDKTIGQLFAEQVQTSPDRIAVVGPTMSNHRAAVRLQITYRRLDEQSDRLAALLSEKGVRADSIVGIMMERSLEMITGILGILKSGGAYLPVATDFPQERIDYMLKDSGAKLLVTGKNKEDENGRWCGGEKVLLEEISRSPKNSSYFLTSLPSCLQNSSSLAYIIYTSGSTGKPKGVMVQHDNVIRVVKNTNYIELDSFDRILQLSGYAFDGSVFDIFGALLNGASLVLISREDVLAVNRLSETIEKEAITVFFVTTALFNTLVDLKIACLSRIRSVLVGGERISTAYSRKALDYLGKGRIVNVYGPTETTVYATYYRIDAIAASSASIPIGKPVSHTTIYILDKNVKPVPIGVFGEIYIGGTGVARGYLNNPELTAGRFKRNVDRYLSVVIRNSSNLTNDRCLMTNDCFYKTGDLARWLPEGNIEFLGRIDHQVKIRGFRVELGEIENRLANYPGIKEAVVLVHEEGQNDKYICAYFISERECNVSELHEFLAKELPDYMIPTYFRQLEQIPLTANGKIDRKALPEPGLKAGRDYVAPGNNVEAKLVNLWAEVLNLEPGLISIDANFFQLGGHSLKATILLAKIQKEFKVNIPLGILFNAPNIRLLAENISREEKTIAIDDAGMVLLKKGRNPENNLFFIHDGSGEVEGYLEFCSCLGSDFSFNCRGIRAERLDNYAPKDISIEEMAGSYIKKIKTLQPSGPFHIVGWSMGGTIAFEITRQLEELNEKVDFLAMIDAVPPFNENTMKVFNPDTERDLIKNLAGGNMFVKELQEITGIENIWAAFVRFLETDNDEAQRIKALAAKSKDLIIPNLDFLNIGEVIRFFNLMRSFVKARAFYMPSSKIDAPVHYFRSSRSQVKNVELWNNFSHNRIKMYDVDGDHYSIFKLPRVIDFAVIFNAAFLKNMK
ncbi:MAG TPA: amino acid adenylation domain-containing protein [Candidatus Deferrimicrobium sp.]|nr:amino acid adenylation domain-containing protein [Candidatus Deferrimicrobium sp.]